MRCDNEAVRSPSSRVGCALSAAALCAATGLIGSSAALAANTNVAATSENTFTPGRVVININDTVTWTTTGGVNHTVTSSTTNWSKDDAIPVPGRSTSFQFKAAGQYNYFCKTHGTANSGMRGVVIVNAPARPAPSPTRSPTVRPSPSPSPSRSPSARPSPSRTPSARPSPSRTPSARPSPSASRPPSPSVATARPIALPTSRPGPPASPSAVPLPTVAAEPTDLPTVDLGSGGLGPRPTTGRDRGLPAFLAIVTLVGVVSAQVRALLALPPDD